MQASSTLRGGDEGSTSCRSGACTRRGLNNSDAALGDLEGREVHDNEFYPVCGKYRD